MGRRAATTAPLDRQQNLLQKGTDFWSWPDLAGDIGHQQHRKILSPLRWRGIFSSHTKKGFLPSPLPAIQEHTASRRRSWHSQRKARLQSWRLIGDCSQRHCVYFLQRCFRLFRYSNPPSVFLELPPGQFHCAN